MVPMQTSQLGRIAHCEILIMVVFRIPLFQEMQSKTLWHQNCCYLPLNFLKDWPSNLNIATKVVFLWDYSARTEIKHLADSCSRTRIFTLHSGSTLKCIYCITNRISNSFNSIAAHLELYLATKHVCRSIFTKIINS